jgi:hypothetical protein
VWECSLRDKTEEELDSVADAIAQWIRHGASNAEIKGGTGRCVKATSHNTSKRSRPRH